jgi:hypothetical protein
MTCLQEAENPELKNREKWDGIPKETFLTENRKRK